MKIETLALHSLPAVFAATWLAPCCPELAAAGRPTLRNRHRKVMGLADFLREILCSSQ